MDYSRLSKESLIHEIEQLNREIEKNKLLGKAEQHGIADCLDDIKTPVYLVDNDYNVLWANAFCSQYYQDILSRKCYQVFYGHEDVCSGCKLQDAIYENNLKNSVISKMTSCGHVKCAVQYFPVIKGETLKGVLEIQYPYNEMFSNSHINDAQSQSLSVELEKMTSKYQHLTESIQNFAKSMLIPLRTFNGYFNMTDGHGNEVLHKQYLDVLKVNSNILFESLNKMLLYTRFNSGTFSGKKESFSVNQLVDETVKQVSFNKNDNTHFNLILSESLPDVLYGDAYSFRLMFSYLLEFAYHIAENEGIEVRLTDIMQTHSKVTLKLSIQATNASHVKVKLMDYFDIGLNSQFEKIDEFSFGLGLHLAEKIVENMDGTIEMSAGSDDVFYVDVSVSYDKIVPQNKEVEAENPSQKNKILIADFEKPELSLDVFKSYDIYFAHDGDDAIKQYFMIDPDITIVNVLIESCDGFKVFDEIERRRKKKAPIIAISNKLIDNEREFMRDYGFDEYYTKPLNDDKLNNIIENYL